MDTERDPHHHVDWDAASYRIAHRFSHRFSHRDPFGDRHPNWNSPPQPI
jgi:hypothetical protein